MSNDQTEDEIGQILRANQWVKVDVQLESDLTQSEKYALVKALRDKADKGIRAATRKKCRNKAIDVLTAWGLSVDSSATIYATPQLDREIINATDGEGYDIRMIQSLDRKTLISNFVNTEARVNQKLINLTFVQRNINDPVTAWCKFYGLKSPAYKARLLGICDRLTIFMR